MFFVLWLQKPIGGSWFKAPPKKPIVWHFCKGWWNVLVQWGTAFSCYLPANLWWLFLTGHVSHPQQNITDVSSSFVFIPQQAAHSSSSVCNTLMSQQHVWLWPLKIPIYCTLKRCWHVWHRLSEALCVIFVRVFAPSALIFLNGPPMSFSCSDEKIINDQVNFWQSLVYDCVQQWCS